MRRCRTDPKNETNLVETDHLPPKSAENEPDENVGDAADATETEVILELDETGAVVARGLTRGVVLSLIHI